MSSAASRTARAVPPDPTLPTRELILDAAERLFAARGVDGVAVRDLARELGITPSSLYNHFPGKQALYAAVLDRGLGPIAKLVAEAWRRGALRREDVRRTVDGLVPHFARHPHLARLLQRAMLEDSEAVRALMGRWLASLYTEGVGVIANSAETAGWQPEEVPHLAIVLFGMVFGYFANAAAVARLGFWADDPLSPRALALQRRILEEAIFRLLGPRRRPAGRRRRS